MTDEKIALNIRGKSLSFSLSSIPSLCADRGFKAIYVINPKSGCTTVKNILYWFDRGFEFYQPEQIHSSYYAFWSLSRYKCSENDIRMFNVDASFTFSMVRHPLDRFVSSFYDKVLSSVDAHYYAGRDFVGSYIGIDLLGDPINAAVKYLSWLQRGEQTYGVACGRQDAHFRPQVENLAVSSKFPIDRVYKIEDISSLISKLESLFERSFEDGQTTQFRKRENSIKDVLRGSLDVKNAVKEFYSRDFEEFGYS